MSKTTAPLLSFGASGQIAKSMVYSKWKGIPYVRRHVVPANPQTEAQMFNRRKFALLREMWKVAPAILAAPWNAFAQGRPFTGMNKLVGENVRTLTDPLSMADFIASPGAKGGLPPISFTPTTGAGSGEIDFIFVAPDPPVGWTLVSSDVIAFRDQAPDGIFTGTISAVSEVAPSLDGTIDGLDAGEDYVVAGWLVWEKPNGQLAYSVGISSVVASGA